MNGLKYYSLAEIAKMFGISRQTVYRLVKCGKLKGELFSNSYYVSKDNLDKYMFDLYAKSKGMNPNKVRDFIDNELYKYEDILEDIIRISKE